MNTLFTCIIYCDGRPGCLIITVCKYTVLILITHIFVLIHFLQRQRESYTFVLKHSYVSCIYLIELMFLEHDVKVYSSFWLFWHYIIQIQLFTCKSVALAIELIAATFNYAILTELTPGTHIMHIENQEVFLICITMSSNIEGK